MAELIRREPFRALRRGDPFSQLREMQRDMERLFTEFFGTAQAPAATVTAEWVPLAETYMKGDNIVVRCELPGVDPKDVDVTVDPGANQIIIRGERKQDIKSEDYIYGELPYGKFERRFTLPAGVTIDQMKAKYMNGLLEIIVPAAAAKPKKVQIEAAKPTEAEAAVKKAA